MEWNVVVDEINHNRIKVYNIFRHRSFNEEICEALQRAEDVESFAEEARRILMYYFWAKCEWEITISSWPYRDEITTKVDVYWQVMNNWRRFVEYVWSFKK